MNLSNSAGLQVSSTDSGFITNTNPSNQSIDFLTIDFGNFNNSFIIFMAMLGLVSYLMNRMPRIQRPDREKLVSTSVKK